MVAHSVLKFNFKGRPVTRGWVEAMIAGDTKCGKTEVAEKMAAFLGLPKPILCEAASFAGVVGGVKDVGGKFSIAWGALPRLDRRMAVLDEVTGLTTDQISQMSGMRSSGVAQLVKIESEKAMARTRKLWLANPRTDRNRRVTTYPYGVMVLPEIIGRAEDISRFDTALVASSEDVPLEMLNVKERKQVAHKHTSEAAKAILAWAWTRAADQVTWDRGVEDLVLDEAIRQSRIYSSQIPLVEPGEQRFRIARIAVALAARFHSADKTGQLIVVKREHVQLAVYFMEGLYASPTTGYLAFSQSKADAERSLDTDKVMGMLAQLESYAALDVALDAICHSEDLNRLAVMDYQQQPKFFAEMARMGLLSYGEGGRLSKTKLFTEFYRAVRHRVGGKPKEAF